MLSAGCRINSNVRSRKIRSQEKRSEGILNARVIFLNRSSPLMDFRKKPIRRQVALLDVTFYHLFWQPKNPRTFHFSDFPASKRHPWIGSSDHRQLTSIPFLFALILVMTAKTHLLCMTLISSVPLKVAPCLVVPDMVRFTLPSSAPTRSINSCLSNFTLSKRSPGSPS